MSKDIQRRHGEGAKSQLHREKPEAHGADGKRNSPVTEATMERHQEARASKDETPTVLKSRYDEWHCGIGESSWQKEKGRAGEI